MGGGVRGWWSHPLRFFFFNALYLVVYSIKPKNKLCNYLEVPISYYFQYKWSYRSSIFHLNPAWYDHDFFEAFPNQSLFQTYPKCVSRPTWIIQLIKKRCKKNLRAITVLKKGRGVRWGMIMITDSMVFLKSISLAHMAWKHN